MLVGIGAVTIATTAAVAIHRAPAERRPALQPAVEAAALPAPPPSALRVRRPRLLDRRTVSIWAPVVARTVAARHAGGAGPLGAVGLLTPEGTTNIVGVLRVTEIHGRVWCLVRLPGGGGSTTGWLPRTALGPFHTVDTRLDIDLARLRLTLYVGGRAAFRAPIGVGTPATPTPTGTFYVRDKLTRYRSPFYGPIAFGTSATSKVLTDWPAGGYIGIHGTNTPERIPGRISHGCIRLRNRDLLRLARLLPVGTPVTIR